MTAPMPRLFPEHVKLILEQDERFALGELFELDPYVEDTELVHNALRAGIKALNRASAEKIKDPTHVTRSQLEARTKATTRTASRFAANAEREDAPTPHRHVERYIACPISEDLRQKLEKYLDGHRTIGEEDAVEFLLDQGLYRDQEMTPRNDERPQESGTRAEDAIRADRNRCHARIAKLRAIAGGRR